VFCPNCRAPLPENARFCLSCGAPIGGAAPPAPPPPPAPAAAATPSAPTSVKCPSCGAALHPMFGDMIVTCDYCGGSVSLGGTGWKGINRHSLLLPKVTNGDEALAIVRRYVDQGFLHRKSFEESTIQDQKLSFVPFWVIPVSASTNFVYSDIAVGVGTTVGTIAAAELLGGALGGRRGGFVPMVVAPPVNPTRQDSISGQYEFPVVAVKGMSAYQPKNYQFRLDERLAFDRKSIPSGAAVLNGDVGEDAAQHAAQAFVAQLQSEAAHKKHHMVSKLETKTEFSDGELLHVPIWYYQLERKGQRSTILIDSHAGAVMPTVG